jgi:hypothetical protein
MPFLMPTEHTVPVVKLNLEAVETLSKQLSLTIATSVRVAGIQSSRKGLVSYHLSRYLKLVQAPPS